MAVLLSLMSAIQKRQIERQHDTAGDSEAWREGNYAYVADGENGLVIVDSAIQKRLH